MLLGKRERETLFPWLAERPANHNQGTYKRFCPPPQSIISTIYLCSDMRISTGCSALDNLLGGGIESGIITELFGEGGTGKTNICIQLSKKVALDGKKVIFLDTEGVSLERLKQIAGDRYEQVSQNVLFFRSHSFQEQEESLDKAVKLALNEDMDVGLNIVDSLTLFYRPLYNDGSESKVSSRLGSQLVKLMKVARRKDIPVVITTQVYESNGTKKPVGGHILYHNAKTILLLEKAGPNIRQSKLVKHRSQSEERTVKFKITDDGIVSL